MITHFSPGQRHFNKVPARKMRAPPNKNGPSGCQRSDSNKCPCARHTNERVKPHPGQGVPVKLKNGQMDGKFPIEPPRGSGKASDNKSTAAVA